MARQSYTRPIVVTLAGVPVILRFERRRYGTGASSRFFTWVHASLAPMGPGEEVVSVGDPWPCVRPKMDEMRERAYQVLVGRSMERLAGAKGRD